MKNHENLFIHIFKRVVRSQDNNLTSLEGKRYITEVCLTKND